MSYRNCIINGVKEGKITKEQAKKQNEMLDELQEYHREKTGLNKTESERLAAKEVYEKTKLEYADKLRKTLLQKEATDKIKLRLDNYRNKNGEVDYAEAARSIYANDLFSKEISLEGMVKVELGKAHALMVNVLDELKYKMGGRQNKNQKTNSKLMIKELFGENTGNINAKHLAEAWKKTAEHLRKQFNRYGGKITSRKDWGLPQNHDTLLVRKVSKADWIEYILPKLDLEKMVNERSGLPFNDKTIREALSEVYDNISTEGMATFKPGDNSFGRSLSNRRLDHRFLAFKSADDWMAYQTRFGSMDPFKTMMEHINGMARDISMLKMLGPNPDATHIWIMQTIKKQADIDAALESQGKFKRKKTFIKDVKTKKNLKIFRDEVDRTNWISENINNLYAYHKGTLHKPVDGFFGRTFAALRQLLTSTQLGGAAVMALSDFNWSRITSKFNGLKSQKANIETLKLLKDGVKSNKARSRIAIRSGLIAEHWSTISGVQARYLNDIDAPMFAKRISDVVLRGSGLSHLTQSGKWGFGMSVMGTFADESGKVFSKLDPNLQKQLKKYGINENDWEIIRKTKLYDAAVDEPTVAPGEVTLLRPDDIHARADISDEVKDVLVTKLLNFIYMETNFAIPTSSARGRTIAAGRTQPGTVQGELLNSALMYKNFAITLGYTHLARGFSQTGLKGKAKYLVPMFITGGVMGALTYELKQMAAGKTMTKPEDMGARYWLNALVYGGGLWIFGDFLFQDKSRYGASMAKTIAGPVVTFLEDAFNLTVGNLIQLGMGEKTNAGKEFAAFVQRYTPGSTVWYIRLAYERLIIDTLEQLINPNFHKDERRKTKALKSRSGQEYWWSPGDLLP